MIKRKTRKYLTRKTKTNRMEKSAIPYMTKLLNDEESEKKENNGNQLKYLYPISISMFQ